VESFGVHGKRTKVTQSTAQSSTLFWDDTDVSSLQHCTETPQEKIRLFIISDIKTEPWRGSIKEITLLDFKSQLVKFTGQHGIAELELMLEIDNIIMSSFIADNENNWVRAKAALVEELKMKAKTTSRVHILIKPIYFVY
jgi:hypothetical protein